MVIRLLPEDVAEKWEMYGNVVEQSMPPYIKYKYEIKVNVLYAIMQEKAVVWEYKGADKRTKCICITAVQTDVITRYETLLIYAIHAIEDMQLGEWQEFLSTIRAYAKSLGLDTIVAFTNVPAIYKLVKLLKGKIEVGLIEIPVEV